MALDPINAAPLPDDLDTMPRSALAALCEARGLRVSQRETAENLRLSLRGAHSMAVEASITRAWKAAHPPAPDDMVAQGVRDALWRLANDYGRIHGEADDILARLEHTLPILDAFVRGDSRVSQARAAVAVDMIAAVVQDVAERRSGRNASAARRGAA
jgi:hypothetical protein